MFEIILIVAAVVFSVLYERSIASRGGSYPLSDHFNGRYFFNPDVSASMERDRTKRKSIWIWMLTKHRGAWERRAITPVVPPERVHEGVRVTYVNHATVLLQFSGLNVITDPVWAYRVSPFSFMGPARFADPGIRFEDLPPIDIVLLSHNHYDHMDLGTLRKISMKWKSRIYTGMGNAAYLARKGIVGAIELDWWQKRTDGVVTVACVPSKHFSARTFSDRNLTLWCGFVLETSQGNLYFAGDTGYGTFVQDIKARYESFALALIPIGAYEPAWMMKLVHTNPDEALRIHSELNVRTSIGIHHGTFRLTDEPQREPVERILASRGDRDFRTPFNGEVETSS